MSRRVLLLVLSAAALIGVILGLRAILAHDAAAKEQQPAAPVAGVPASASGDGPLAAARSSSSVITASRARSTRCVSARPSARTSANSDKTDVAPPRISSVTKR